MITEKKTDILSIKADIIVIPVNCRGVMGAGLAKQFEKKYAHLPCISQYKGKCARSEFTGGDLLWGDLYEEGSDNTKERKVLFFATKENWKHSSKIAWIRKGLTNMFCELSFMDSLPPSKIAMPKVGCGLGMLSWDSVYPLIEQFYAMFCERFGFDLDLIITDK